MTASCRGTAYTDHAAAKAQDRVFLARNLEQAGAIDGFKVRETSMSLQSCMGAEGRLGECFRLNTL